MPLYLTPQGFLAMKTGVDLSSYEEQELASILEDASSQVNTVCAAPTLPSIHDFRGGTITGEQHRWRLGNEVTAPTRRYYPMHQPVLAISQFRINVTAGSYIDISTDDLYTNNQEGWVEIVALSLGIGTFPVVANLGMNQPVATMNYTYGRSLAVTGDHLYETDGQTFRAQNQWWHTSPAPVIYVNGVDSTADFTIDYDEGTATHDSTELVAGDTVTADYSHKLPHAIARATALFAIDAVSDVRRNASALAWAGRIRVAEVEVSRPVATMSANANDTPIGKAEKLLAPYSYLNVSGF